LYRLDRNVGIALRKRKRPFHNFVSPRGRIIGRQGHPPRFRATVY
jgi:hypothetical protein